MASRGLAAEISVTAYAAHLIRGSSLNWWNGGGEGRVHSSVVAPAPHRLCAGPPRIVGGPLLSHERVRDTGEENQRASRRDERANRRHHVPAGEGVRIV